MREEINLQEVQLDSSRSNGEALPGARHSTTELAASSSSVSGSVPLPQQHAISNSAEQAVAPDQQIDGSELSVGELYEIAQGSKSTKDGPGGARASGPPDPEHLARFLSKQTHALETRQYDASYNNTELGDSAANDPVRAELLPDDFDLLSYRASARSKQSENQEMQFDGQIRTAQVVRERHCDLDGDRFYVRNPYAMDASAELGHRDHHRHGQPDSRDSPAAGSNLRFTLFRKEEVDT